MKQKLVMLLTCLFIGISMVMSQSPSKVTGIVISEEDNLPIVGASVQVKGTSIGGVTDLNGSFTISNVPSSAKLLKVSFIGMKTQEVPIKAGKIRVVLKTDSEVLQEVVVTGMQKIDKRLFTGASTKITGDKVKMDGMPDISRALEGRAAGVSVQNVSGTFGTAPKIRVRGATSIYGSSKPLWVVDGVIMEDVTEVGADDLSSGDAVTLISSAISGLNADDIESFQILKDGSATSIYGARAMAGVIVVTTKKGKAGSNKISYTGEFTMRLKPNYRDFNIMNSQEQMGVYSSMANGGYLNFSDVFRADDSGVYGKMYHLINTYDPNKGYALENTLAARSKYLSEAEYRNTDWFDVLFNNSVSQNHAVSFSSGTEKASYYTSLSFMNDPGWTKQSSVQRYTANINATYNILKNLTMNLIGNASYRSQKAPGTLSSNLDVVSGEVKRDFDINPYSYAMNTSRTLDPNEFYIRNYAPFNILNELDNNNMKLSVTDLKFQGELRWKVSPKFELATLAAYKVSNTIQAHSIKDFSNQSWAFRAMDDATMRDANPWLYTDPEKVNTLPVSVLPVGGFYKEDKYGMNSWDLRSTFSYNDSFNDDTHIVNFLGGMEINSTNRNRTWFNGVGMQYEMGMLPAFDYLYFKQASEEKAQYYGVEETRSREVSFIATGTYSYKGRYTVNGTVRYGGSNKLGKSQKARWLPVWNVSGAWNAHEEKFFESLRPAFSNMMFKVSYSLTADRGPAFVSNSRVIIKSYNPWRPTSSVSESGLEIDNLENSELTYEKKHELNIGTELGFLNNRINVAFDWYKRNNYDLIGSISTMGGGGQITKYANVASMKSHGVELTLSTRNIESKDFKWSSDFIFSKTKNEITSLESNSRVIDLISGVGYGLQGHPVRALFSMDFQGLNDLGLPTFINEEGKTVVSDIDFQERDIKSHLKYEGPTDPTLTGSFGNIFAYKNFKLNVFMTYSFGNVIRLDPVFRSRYSDLDAMPKEFKNRWTVTGDEKITNIPVIADRTMNQQDSQLNRAYNAYNYSTARIAKGDFIRMKEISLAYDFPKSWIRPLKLNDLSLKLQASNLFLIYSDDKLNGQDPEFFNTGGVAAPVPRQFTLTLRLGL